MKLTRLFKVIALTSIIGSSLASAETKNNSSNFYLGADLGYTAVSDNTQLLANTLVTTVGGSASASQNSSIAIGRLYAGYNFNENFGFELGYGASSNINYSFNGVSGGLVPYTGSATESFNGLDYSLVARPSISSGLNNLFFKAGGTYFTDKTTVSVATSSVSASSSNSASGSGYLLGVGYDIPVAESVDFRISYTYLNKVAGISGSNANVFSAGILKRF